MRQIRSFSLGLVLLIGCAFALAAPAAEGSGAGQLWQLLDYLAVDYSGAVAKGAVVSASEYAEMIDFAQNATNQAGALPEHPSKAAVQDAVQQLHAAVLRKSDATEVATLAHRAEDLLIAAYPIPVAPKGLPDLKRGATLFQTECASCHGKTGAGDGPLAAKLDPPPVAFTDRERARSRSILALYQIVTRGVSGTSMPSFATLSEQDRWSLGFFAGTLSHSDAMPARGGQLWNADASAKARFPNLAAVTTLTEAAIADQMPADVARDLTAYVRSHPEAATIGNPTGALGLARSRLRESLAAAHAGDKANATRLGLSAYLDGFEPLEPALGARNGALLAEVEGSMLAYRGALASGELTQAEAVARKLDYLFAQVENELGSGRADALATFLGSLTILLREGLEALLIVVGIIAFLRKAERRDVLNYVHAGWILALVAGGATWMVATYFINISGASREVTEGVSSVFAAVVLLSVGLWMHQKSTSGRWQAYLKGRLSAAMSKRSAWALFGLSFIAVYREVFETVLFYSALSGDGNNAALLLGLGVGILILGVITWLMLRTSARMPIGKFFSLSSILVAVLAVVLAGKGIAALQEVGWVSANPIHWPRLDILGIYPSAETAIAQIAVLVIALAGFALNSSRARPRLPT